MAWRVMGFRLLAWAPGRADVGWEAPLACCTQVQGAPVVRGGLVTAVLDAAMGAACWSVLEPGQVFVTAETHAEFALPCRPGEWVARGIVGRRKREVVQCAAEFRSADGQVCVTARCTQILVSSDAGGPAGAVGGGASPIVRG